MSNLAAIVPEAKAQIVLENRSIPTPQGSEILVKNHALAINPADWKIQKYAFFVEQYPNVLGSDACGIVEAVGPEVKHFKKGDRVTGFAMVILNQKPDHGAFQQYTLLYENCTAKIPDNVTFEQGSLIPMALATAGVGIWVDMNIPKPSAGKQSGAFLVWGGSSSVGSVAIQIAASLGYTVYATCSPRNSSYVKSLGAIETFDYNDKAVVSHITSSIKTAGHDTFFAYDAIAKHGSSPQTGAVLEALGGGKLLVVLDWPEDVKKPANVEVLKTLAFRIATDQQEFGRWLFNEWTEKALEDKTYVPSPGIEVVEGGLGSVQKAFELNEKGMSGKKLVLPLA